MAEQSPSPTDQNENGDATPRKPERRAPIAPAGWVLGLMLALTLLMFAQQMMQENKEVSFSTFYREVLAENVSQIEIEGSRIHGVFIVAPLIEASASESGSSVAGGSKSEDQPASSPPGKESSDTETEPDEQTDKDPSHNESDNLLDEDEPLLEADRRLPLNFVVEIQGGVDSDLRQVLIDHHVRIKYRQQVDWSGILTLVWFGVLIALAVVMFSFFRRARDQMMGGGMLGGVTKSPARRYDSESSVKVTFDDVAGLKGVKRDLKEVVEFLRDPEKFQLLGATVPKGVLLNGPPGTGKTLLAKAVAGESGVPFYSISGSEFIQLFVGVGASRVRDMFKTAKRNAPSILFIDEIDAVGRQRGAGLGGGHDEREQTLNQILSEMDGFSPTETVIVIAATNRPDVLDPALLRPGRFDRHVTVDRPSLEGRVQLFEVHSRQTPLAEDVDFEKLARATVGLTGADIRNLVNEAALWATRHDKSAVSMDDFEHARDKALMGACREDVMTEPEKKVCAYHEAGHTLVAWSLPSGARVHKVTIIPRGRALGVTQIAPDEDRHNMSQHEMHAQLAMLLAGRAAEKLIFDEYSTGAENDLKEATRIARRMVTHWGMSDRLGPVAYHTSEESPFLGREIVQEHRHFSEHTAQVIDDEVAKILHHAADRATRLLTEGHSQLEAISRALLDKEELDASELEQLIGPSVQPDSCSLTPPVDSPPASPSALPSATRGGASIPSPQCSQE